MLRARTNATNETRKVGEQSGGDGAVPYQAEIRCECAFTCMNAVSRKNLTDARAVVANHVRTALDTGAALGGVIGIAPSRRMIVTRMWGVSDPQRAGRGAKKGAAKWGSLTPHCRFARLRQRRRLATGGKERRRQWYPNSQTSKNMDGPHVRHRSNDARDRPARRFLSRGNGAPEFRFPHPVPLSRVQTRQPGAVLRVREGLGGSRCAYRARRIVPRAAADLDRAGSLSRRATAAGSLTGTNRSDGYM
jgi:hypothetical protein